MTLIDYIILIGYFIGIVTFGLWISRRIKSSDDYFRGNRKFKWWIMMGQAFSTGTHAEMPVAQTGVTYNLGFATIWYQWKNMLITPFYWLIAPFYRRSNRTTVGDIIEDRYGKIIGLMYSIFAMVFFVFIMGAMLQGAAKVISVLSDNMISPTGVVLAMTVAFIVYSFAGGLIAAAYTDFFQGLLIIVLSIMLIPLGLNDVGGFSGMREVLPEDFFDLMNSTSGIDGFTLAMLAVNGMVGITAQPHMVAMCGTGNTERAGRIGQTFGSLVKRLVTIGWALTGLIVAAMVIKHGVTLEDPEYAFGYGARELLGPGLLGLMFAAIVAANMSSLSTFMVNNGALFTQNIYKEYINPEAPDRKLLTMGRYSGLVLSLVAVLFALSIDNVLHAFLFTETIAAFVGIIFLGGVIWKRANRYGAGAAVLVALVSYYWINYSDTGELVLVYKWLPAPFGWAMLLGFAAFFIVSLLTKPEDPKRIEKFFDEMRRKSDSDTIGPDGKPPLASETGDDLLLLDLPGWFRKDRWKNFFQRYREDLIGFGLSWIFIGLIILLAWGILQIGG
ncbi:sodium:solute symporter family protein [Membranicola marinus]|uniref:Sodium:solute symporter family protein n=1 Tax=Membranihabitans marinus TaxID=1227546 RepID=A0A953LD83_9BACT|nr:sodium:solute symporter family protein [Membranihabitans marinus]MBY5960281.1 sodium:solute symporter family protein [Membranihabitans marinus]